MNTTAQEEIDAYVAAVREALVGLPEATRRELLEDLPEHLAEVLAEGSGSLTDRLGPPAFYAAELRAATGFVGGFPDPPPSVDRVAQLRAMLSPRLDAADLRVGPLLGHARASEFFALLRPAWWVLRGYLAAMVLAYLLDDSGQPIGLLPRIGGSELVALLLLGGSVLASIWLGRRTAELTVWPRYAVRSATVLLALAAFTMFVDADQDSRGAVYQDTGGYSDPYSGVEDVFVYDQQGRLLTNVQLFDQNGSPIRLGNAWCSEEPSVDERLYPRCPQNAPFRMGGPPVGEPAESTGRATTTPTPTASVPAEAPATPSAPATTVEPPPVAPPAASTTTPDPLPSPTVTP